MDGQASLCSASVFSMLSRGKGIFYLKTIQKPQTNVLHQKCVRPSFHVIYHYLHHSGCRHGQDSLSNHHEKHQERRGKKNCHLIGEVFASTSAGTATLLHG